MPGLVISAAARRDIANALQHSGQRWGMEQRGRYRSLIEDALNDLLETPEHPAGRARDDLRPGIRTFHIARRGRPGRHFVVYRVAPDGGVQVLRLLHDAMELSRALAQVAAQRGQG